ncbi:MAG: helix-turn-helix transcriptional regulator [Bacteroidetes bacterium]|nr:helix-turn-helix transcriptional regulator [Bacteroidota bacterium]
MIENPQLIGEHIKNRRIQLRLSQSDVAKILDVCEDSVTGWENGRSTPHIKYYPKLIEFLGYNPFPFETETLGGKLKKYRILNGLSQKEFAKKIGVNESTVFAWEKGNHVPFPRIKKLLEELLNQNEPST